MSAGVAQASGAFGALGLAVLLVATRRDLRVGGLAAWAIGCGMLTIYLAPHGHHRVLAGAAVLGLVAAAVGAWVVLRVPWLLAVAVLACAPARIPVHVGSTQANLLLPLYGVVVVAAIALAWELYGEDARSRELGPLAWPLAVFIGWTGLSFLWTKDVRQGAIELLFFILPFGLLTVVLARLAWSRGWVLVLYVQLAVMALVFAVIGIVQYETRSIFWNPKVRVDNAYAPSGWFYRVNSVFYDPSIYGRFLVIGDPREPGDRAVPPRRPALVDRSHPRHRDHVGRAAAVVLAVELRRAARGRDAGCASSPGGGAASSSSPLPWSAMVLGLIASPAIRHKASLSHVTSGRSTLVSKG